MKRIRLLVVLLLAGVGGGAYYYAQKTPDRLTLTGIVTTRDVIVSPQIAGRIGRLFVKEGDTVKAGQLAALLVPDELRQESAFYTHSAQGAMSQVNESAAALRLQERQTIDQIGQAEATLASAESQLHAAEAELENAKLTADRLRKMAAEGVVPDEQVDQARTAHDAARARVASLARQADAQRSAVALARANAVQIAVRRSQLESSERLQAAADSQRAKADVRLAYTELHAPISGIVDVLAVRDGEFVEAGQPVVTLINPDDLWVRADVEETYIDRVRIGDKRTVRLPSGETREGTVVYRGVNAGFATQRDVSRTKRDIKTFEIRLRVNNADRRLAVGMTAYVLLPVK
ncbi:MAG: HlyD family secretion protein [Acidobacteriota bacterium]|jgi:multidrug resistance efflux pump|nr:HlyD family secretion protein [Acidobacteriota bacterium]